jgi:hypothetical protein
MNDSELHILEIIDKKSYGLREDSRTEFQAQFMRHDASDNERFAELFQRLRPLELAADIQVECGQSTRACIMGSRSAWCASRRAAAPGAIG